MAGRQRVILHSWNDKDPKYDIRDWAKDHEKMGKGVMLSKDEAEELLHLLSGDLN